jgi:hypothetical protein
VALGIVRCRAARPIAERAGETDVGGSLDRLIEDECLHRIAVDLVDQVRGCPQHAEVVEPFEEVVVEVGAEPEAPMLLVSFARVDRKKLQSEVGVVRKLRLRDVDLEVILGYQPERV